MHHYHGYAVALRMTASIVYVLKHPAIRSRDVRAVKLSGLRVPATKKNKNLNVLPSNGPYPEFCGPANLRYGRH